MCFNLAYTLKKGKFVIVRKDNNEENEDMGLLVKEIEKWNRRHEKVTREDADIPRRLSTSKHNC